MLNSIEVQSCGYDARDYGICKSSDLPDTYRCPCLVPVKNQGSMPTCVAHACASLIEYHYKRQNDNKYRAFSTEFIYGFRDVGYYVGGGMRIRDALKTITKFGDPLKTDCPGNHDLTEAMKNINKNIVKYKELGYAHRISAYYTCKTADEIKTAIITHGPVVASMNTYSKSKIVDDVYTYDEKSKSGRHCILIYGWDDRGWLIQNSWGTKYAGDGRFILPIDYKFNEAWGVTDNIVDDAIKKPKVNKFTNWIYLVYNKIVNWWITKTNKT